MAQINELERNSTRAHSVYHSGIELSRFLEKEEVARKKFNKRKTHTSKFKTGAIDGLSDGRGTKAKRPRTGKTPLGKLKKNSGT